MIAIVPTHDIKEHEDYNTTCECEPRVIFENGEMIIIHNAYDGREFEEQIKDILNGDESESV